MAIKSPDVELMQILPFSVLCKLLPGEPTAGTLRRWARDGVLSDSGKLIRLATKRLPNGRGSSLVLYSAFLDALNE